MLNAHLILAFLWILFGVLHSVLASLTLKERFAKAFPKQSKYYRLYYSLFAFLTFGLVLWYQLQLASSLVFERTVFSTGVGTILTITGLIIMIICIKKYFLSLSGIKSLFQERPSNRLMINGIHRYVRHPLYLGTFIAIWGIFLLYPVLSFLISNIAITAYTLLGIGFEERKLVAEFGPDYKHYQQTVPRLIPSFRRKP